VDTIEGQTKFIRHMEERIVGNNHPALKSNNSNTRRTGNTINLTMRTALF
jgi:hypothetical protein